MLTEYAATPEAFDPSSYSSKDLADHILLDLKDVFTQEAVLRDLRDGEWSSFVSDRYGSISGRTKELFKKLNDSGRLRRAKPIRKSVPVTHVEWCQEALESSRKEPLDGIITSKAVAQSFREHPIVSSVEGLRSAPWWQARSHDAVVPRMMGAYLERLRLLLKHANSLIFIDPDLDPTEAKYKEFGKLLLAARRDDGCSPDIEFHRHECKRRGKDKERPSPADWEKRFGHLRPVLQQAGLSAHVYLWDNLHARFLLSDLMCIKLEYGFDTTTKPNDTQMWTRLSTRSHDEVQTDHEDGVSKKRNCVHRFEV